MQGREERRRKTKRRKEEEESLRSINRDGERGKGEEETVHERE